MFRALRPQRLDDLHGHVFRSGFNMVLEWLPNGFRMVSQNGFRTVSERFQNGFRMVSKCFRNGFRMVSE